MQEGWPSRAIGALRRLGVTRRAGRARDAGRFAEAADLYARALTISPLHTGLRIQLGNMLKDSGRFEEAEVEYRRAVAERPSDPEPHLQLGHLQKIRGRVEEATSHYWRAASLAPATADADRELVFLGDRNAQEARFKAALAKGEIESLYSIAGELALIRERLDTALALLPDVASQAAFPLSYYHVLRRLWDASSPPIGPIQPSSVLIFMDGVSHDSLNRMASSLSEQSAREFQVVLAGAETTRRTWASRLAAADPRFELKGDDVGGRDWARFARHDLILLPAPGAVLSRHALAWFGWAASNTTAAALICDDERRGNGIEDFPRDPALRHAVDHEMLLQANPFGQTVAFDRRRCPNELKTIGGLAKPEAALALLLEIAASASIAHVPFPLVELATEGVDGAPLSSADYASVVMAHLSRRGLSENVEVSPLDRAAGAGAATRWRSSDRAGVSIGVVIPTRDNGRDVLKFVNSLRALAQSPGRVRITVMDNGTTDSESLHALTALRSQNVEVIRCDEPFNWSRLSNLGASRGDGDILLFANDDMVMLTAGWDATLDGLLQRPEVGIVGAKLLYPTGAIQHAGVLLGWNGRAIHDGLYEDRYAPGPGGRWQLRRRVSAVTGAFLAIRKTVFDEVGGFDEQRLAIGYSDLDLAFKVRERGLAVLYAPEIELTHFESKSRGMTPLREASRALDDAELRLMRRRWPSEFDADVSVHPAWYAATLPFRLLSAPTSENVVRHLMATALPDPWRPRRAEGGA
jgi:GT2 family glycosyltransferase/tetratricopeptide (TPR) repeat protein